ncbi:SLATT domain-containing protein [Winogradskyella sp. PAMC22761]|nr:SLATT domain-containing protein [Winogradskyella sp. PAMC22761]
MDTSSQVKILESQIRECFGRVVWTHKTQEKCADIISERHNIVKYIQIGLSALTTTGVLITVFGENKIIGIITAVLSAILFAINTYVKGHDLGEIAQKHSESASDLWNIREEYFSLLTDLKAEVIELDELIQKRDSLQDRLSNVYKGSPRTINKAYTEATKALKLNEELTLSDSEINMFLPNELKKEISE